MTHRSIVFLLLLGFAMNCSLAYGADKRVNKTPERKVVQRVIPVYPELAGNANITAMVQLLVMVEAKGQIRTGGGRQSSFD